MAIDKLNFNSVDIGKVDLPDGKFADTLMQYGQQLNETERQRRLDAQNALSMQMDQARFARSETEFNRKQLEQKAVDAYNSDIANGPQVKGGVLNTQSLINTSNKYDMTPQEIEDSKTYRDEFSARAAGKTALADKIAWQTKLSDFATSLPSLDVGKETRPEMYERALSGIRDKGLPVLDPMVTSLDQARLAEKTADEAELKRLKEAKADILKNDQANAWKYINALGNTSTIIDENGNEVQVNKGPSTSIQNRNNNSFNNDVDKGLTDILKTIEDKAKGTESTSKAVVSDQAINLYTTLVRDQGISPEVASKLVSSGVGSEEAGWKSLWLGDPKAKLTKDQLSTILPSAMSAMELKKDVGGGTTSTVKGNDKQEAATSLITALSAQNNTQLSSILGDQAKLARGAEGRRDDKINAWLQGQGLVDAPSTGTSAIKSGNKTNLNAANPDAVVTPTINKNIKKIDGIPDSLVASEGVTNKAYKLEGEKNYTIGMGYNLGYNNIDNDFKAANIPVWKAELAKNNPEKLILDDGEASRLAQVSYYSRAEELDKSLGGKFADLSPEMQATAMQMKFRGDLNDSSHGKTFSKLIAANDYDGLTRYIVANAGSLPEPIVTRFNNDLGMPNKTKVLDGKSMTESERSKYLDNPNKTLDKNTDSSKTVAKSDTKGLSIADTVKVSELKPSSEIKKDIDMLNYSLKKYSNINEVPKSELDTLKVLSDNYSLALKNERINKTSKDPFYKNFNWGRKQYDGPKYNISDEEKILRAIKENPNASTEELGLEDRSLDFLPLGQFAKTKGFKSSTYDKDVFDAIKANTKVGTKASTAADVLTVDQTILRDTFGKYSPNVQGVNRAAGITKDEIVAEMVKLRELKNPSKYDLQELQRLNELLGRFSKKPTSTKAEF